VLIVFDNQFMLAAQVPIGHIDLTAVTVVPLIDD
jgi:hypothetical protein